MKPHILCYRSQGVLWWECFDEFSSQVGRTPIDAWDNWFNRSVPF